MTKAAEYRQKAGEYEALALKTESVDLRQFYEAMAREFRSLADAHERLEAKRPELSDNEVQQLAERMTDNNTNKP
jgi:hypothetical protein